jgi:release factor glutamine methyltransferase
VTPTVLDIVRKTADFLAAKGVESARRDAELLVGHALGLPRMQLYLQFERPVAEADLAKIRELVRRRGRREPLQHIVGTVEFCGLALRVDRRALIPRPETERLVEIILERRPEAPRSLLDLGTGSGAIALALAKAWPAVAVTAVDASAEALALARENAAAAGLEARIAFLQSDWFEALAPGSRFGLVAANPPYLTAEEAASAAPEVRDHEPARALAAGRDGLSEIRKILEGAPERLEPGGLLAMETGIGHRAEMARLAAGCGWRDVEVLPDLAGRDRFFLARR